MSLGLALVMVVGCVAYATPSRADELRSSTAAADSRLTVQLVMLLGFLYVACLCVWFLVTRHVRAVSPRRRRRLVLQRVRAAQRAAPEPAAAHPMWTCEIAWQPGRVRSRFQAVMAPPDNRTRQVVAESEGLHWPPDDVRKPPTRELEAALGALVASIVGAGWEAVQSGGSWSERRFVWRREGEPPTKLEVVAEKKSSPRFRRTESPTSVTSSSP